jgi:hypothetical protein
VQPIEPIGKEPTAPFPDRVPMDAKALSHLDVVPSLGTGQHDPASKRQSLRALWTSGPPLERLALDVAQHHRFENRSPHRRLLSSLTKRTTRCEGENSFAQTYF